jgi:PAS domain S-box-containing protein
MPATLYRMSMSTEGKISVPFISDGLVELVGISPRQISSNPYQLLDLIHPEDLDQFKALIKAGFDKLATFRHEFRIIAITGEVKWVQNITRYYRTNSGTVLADGVCIDISERGEAESNLQRTNELLLAVIKAVPVAIDIISPDGKVLLWNASAERLFAWNTSPFVGYPVPSIPEAQSIKLQAAILDTLAGEPLDGIRIDFQLRDGSWTRVSISTLLVHDPHGEIIGVLRIIDDLGNGDRHIIKNDDNNLQLESSSSQASAYSRTEAVEDIAVVKAHTLLSQYKTGQRNFAGLNLRGANFVKADLSEVNFSGVALNGSNCNHSNFQHAILRGADLRGANFQYADLRWVDLRGADLRGADLKGANTLDVIFDDSNFLNTLL